MGCSGAEGFPATRPGGSTCSSRPAICAASVKKSSSHLVGSCHFAQESSGEINFVQIRINQVDPIQDGTKEIGPSQGGAAQIGPAQVRPTQRGSKQAHDA